MLPKPVQIDLGKELFTHDVAHVELSRLQSPGHLVGIEDDAGRKCLRVSHLFHPEPSGPACRGSRACLPQAGANA